MEIGNISQKGLRVFRVQRPRHNLNFPEYGSNAVIVVAQNGNQAKGIAMESTCLVDEYLGGITKRDLEVIDITDELEIGYIIAKE